jgi:hypothetical protein
MQDGCSAMVAASHRGLPRMLNQDTPMPTPSVELHALPGDYVIARLPATAPVPSTLLDAPSNGGYVSITRTPQELSIVCPSELAPADAEIDGTWRASRRSSPLYRRRGARYSSSRRSTGTFLWCNRQIMSALELCWKRRATR